MRTFVFAARNSKEILRDPLSYIFGLGFPVVLLLLMTAIQRNIPVALFELDKLTPGMNVFGYSFLGLFSAQLVSRDRESSFFSRLLTTPLRSSDYLIGYILPFLLIGLLQNVIVIAVACLLGLPFEIGILWQLVAGIPVSLLFIALGVLLGSCLNEKQVGGICGALLTNLTAWFGGIWFDLSMVGKGFVAFARLLPFVHAVELGQKALRGEFAALLPDLGWIIGYTVVLLLLVILLFERNKKNA